MRRGPSPSWRFSIRQIGELRWKLRFCRFFLLKGGSHFRTSGTGLCYTYRAGYDAAMAYVLNVLVTEVSNRSVLDGLRIVPLTQGKGLIPLSKVFWGRGQHSSQPILREWEARHAPDADFGAGDERAAHIKKAQSAFAYIAELCTTLSAQSPVAYLEADFFGGTGGQASAVWERGAITFGPTVASDAINQALAKIGIARGLGDEFETLGLQRHRFTEEWLPKE